MADQNFTMYSGDTQDITVTVVDDDSASVAMTGMSIEWVMARAPGQTAVVTKTTDDSDITISGNTFSFTIDPADTTSLDGRYYHEAEATDGGGDIATVMVGWITIVPDTT